MKIRIFFFVITCFLVTSFVNAKYVINDTTIQREGAPRLWPSARSSLFLNCRIDDTVCQTILSLNPSLQFRPSDEIISSKLFPTCSAEDMGCPADKVCAETGNGFRCVDSLDEGDVCVHPSTDACAPGLECINNRCTAVLLEGSQCARHTDTMCRTGTYCIGKPNKFCVRPMAIGDECMTDVLWICDPNDICSHYRCVKKLRINDVCDSTQEDEFTNTLCPHNSVCVLNGDQRRCTSLSRPDMQQWLFFAANNEGYVFHNGDLIGGVYGWRHFAAVNITLKMGDVVSFIIKGGSDWTGFIAAIGAYQVGKPSWSIRSGVQEFRTHKAFFDRFTPWMTRDYDACHWQNVTTAPEGAELGDGMSKTFPYWTNARYMWASDAEESDTIFVRFKRGGHKCNE